MNTGGRMIFTMMTIIGLACGSGWTGDLSPPGSPEGTMRTLQEIYDKLLEIEAKIDAMAGIPDDPDPELAIIFDFEDGDRQAIDFPLLDITASFHSVGFTGFAGQKQNPRCGFLTPQRGWIGGIIIRQEQPDY